MRIWLNIMRLIMHHARHFLTGLNHESLLGKKTGLVTIALGITYPVCSGSGKRRLH
jgi:hypothetical protein